MKVTFHDARPIFCMTLAVDTLYDAQTTLAKLIAKFSVDSDVVFKLCYV